MARRLITAAALVLLCASVARASSRFILDDVEGASGRDLLQTKPNCTRINTHCDTCRNQRIPGTRRSELVCSTCKTGYRLRRDGVSKTCDCAPGLAFDSNSVCQSCEKGMFCLGGDAKVNPANTATACPDGLATTFVGAKSQAQCFTKPGYGRKSSRNAQGKVTLAGEICEEGTYNVGSNTAGCQKCGAGLTTATTGSNSSALCLAPAGSYLDKGIGKKCQKGTYSTALNADPNCTPCPAGITTATEGSDSADACALAIKGYYMVNATAAAECPLHTYNDQEANITACTDCPNGWKTKEEGATGVAVCLAPPGWELKAGANNITECENGLYKADWNRNPCLECGANLITAGTGSVSKDACLVPVGYGLTSLSPMAAAPCGNNTYGDAKNRTAAANARCTACPADMFTLDTLTGLSRAGLYTSEDACLVKPGWGTTATLPQACPLGTYNAGLNREPCKECITGMTTTATERTSVAQCVIQAGWQMGSDSIPAPCDKGTFSIGGNEGAPNATCTACGTGYSTQEDESIAADECSVCAPGFGGGACTQCNYNTYAYGGAAVGEACVACATGSVSRKRATQVQQCYSRLVDVRNDVFSINATSDPWTANNNSTAVACGDACTGDCIMYRFTTDGTNTCQLYMEAPAGGQKLGFKIGNGDDYVIREVPTDHSFGVAISTPAAANEAACLAACTASSECEVFSWVAAGTTCTLAKSELDQDYTSMYAVAGNKLYSDINL